jgi:two-component system, chemotaxis family, sensor kinase CheA
VSAEEQPVLDVDYAALRDVFEAEAGEALDTMEQALLTLEAHPDAEAEIGTLFRLAHTLKGNAASMRLETLSEVTHVLEDVLDRRRNHLLEMTDEVVTLLLESVDALREMLPAADEGAPLAPRHAALLARLRGLTLAVSPERVTSRSEGGPEPGSGAPSQELARSRTLRVGVATLDRLLDLTGEIAVARGRLRLRLERDATVSRPVLEAHREADRLHAELQELVMRVRMVPLAPRLARYGRVVRDAAAAVGKSARLELRGDDVAVDTKVAEAITDPLTHLVRNAVAHGIETPALRRAAGKDPRGRVAIVATREPGSILIEVSDDGAGLDRDRILEAARLRGLLTAEVMGREAAVPERLIFEPGFSTATEVSELSGRGVGLDVVRRNVEALRGSLDVTTRPGHGTRFLIRLPLTLAIIQGFGVSVADETFIVPLESVMACLELPATAAPGRLTGILNLRGESLPFVRLRRQLQVEGETPSREHVVVVRHRERRVGIVADRLLGDIQSVVKPLARPFRNVPGVAGTTILGDGRVALLLDVAALVEEAAGAAVSHSLNRCTRDWR